MTGRTHDLAAFSALSYVFINYPPNEMSLGTLVAALGANFLGGLYPDLDNASADLWHKIPGGSLIGTLLSPLMGGHRMISHSILGYCLTGFLLHKLLLAMGGFLLVNMQMVWLAFMIGYLSHMAADLITKEGIPLFFPLPLNLGFPPFKKLRITTGAKIEKFIIYPTLLLGTGYYYALNYARVLDFLQHRLH